MWKALIELFKNNSDHRKLVLKDKLPRIKMQKNGIVAQYLSKFTQFHDALGSVGVNSLEDDLEILALLGLPKN